MVVEISFRLLFLVGDFLRILPWDSPPFGRFVLFTFSKHFKQIQAKVSTLFLKSLVVTLLETNTAPENGPSQMEFYFPTIDFQGRTVRFREGRYWVVVKKGDEYIP